MRSSEATASRAKSSAGAMAQPTERGKTGTLAESAAAFTRPRNPQAGKRTGRIEQTVEGRSALIELNRVAGIPSVPLLAVNPEFSEPTLPFQRSYPDYSP